MTGPPYHGRTHLPDGTDPIGIYPIETTNDVNDPDVDPTQKILVGRGLILTEPEEGTARIDAVVGETASPYASQITTDQPMHWWRMREPDLDDGSDREPDVGFGGSPDDMGFSTNGAGSTEITELQAGPNPDLISIRRIRDVGFNAPNYWSGQAAVGDVPIADGEEFSYEGWWKIDNTLAEFDLFNWTGSTDDYLVVNADGSVTLGRDGTTFSTDPGVVVEDAWRYYCVVVDGSTVRLYVNPAADLAPLIDEPDPASTTGLPTVFAVGSPNGAGGSGGAADGAPDGYLSEVAVYSYALTPEQVRAHFVSGLYGDVGEVPLEPSDLAPGEEGQHLVTRSGVAVWETQVLDDIDDVNAPTPSAGDVLTWDDTPGEWVAAAPASGSLDLDDLNDVTITSVSDGDLLAYDTGSGDWVNVDPGTVASGADVQVYTSGTPTWTKPTGAVAVRVICIGAGGSGGSGCNGNSTARAGGSGGGGGAVTTADFQASDLTGTVAVTVGTGGSAKTGGAGGAGTDGDNGGSSSFGAFVFAGGGGGGKAGGTSSQSGGGGASQNSSANGTNGGTSNGGATAPAADAIGGQGSNGTSVGRRAEWGGGAGGGSGNAAAGTAGGPAIFGGPAGGGGGGCNASNTGFAGDAGGANGYGALGGGGAGGGIGSAGTSGSNTPKPYCGTGGGGGGGSTGATGKNGGNGGVGAGGGGGGCGTNTNAGGDSGAGGSGRVIVITWL